MSKYVHIARGKSASNSRWPNHDGRWDDQNRVLCLAAGAGDTLSLKWALEESRLLIHGHPVRRRRNVLPEGSYTPDWPDPFCYGWTALHRSCSSGRKDVVKLLLDRNWHLNRRTWDGFVASDVVGMNGYTHQGFLDKPKKIRKRGLLSDEEKSLYLWLTKWTSDWKRLVQTSYNLFLLQSVRRSTYPHLTKCLPPPNASGRQIVNLWHVDKYWVRAMEIIFEYILGVNITNELGERGRFGNGI